MPAKPREPLLPEVYARVFEGHPEAAQILDELILRFARPAKRDGGIDAILETYHRLGARSVLDFITIQIDRANGVNEHAES